MISLHLVSPDSIFIIQKNLIQVTIPGLDWQLEILPGHMQLITALQSWDVTWEENKEYKDLEAYKEHKTQLTINGWIAYCANNKLTIITN